MKCSKLYVEQKFCNSCLSANIFNLGRVVRMFYNNVMGEENIGLELSYEITLVMQ